MCHGGPGLDQDYSRVVEIFKNVEAMRAKEKEAISKARSIGHHRRSGFGP